MKVMVVDDERHMTEYLKHIIDWEEYGIRQIALFNDAVKAEAYLKAEEPDLLIVDICMPEISGLELAKWIKDQQLKTKVMIVSGFSEFGNAQQAMRYGVTEYLVKPVLKNEFIQALGNILPLVEKKESHPAEPDSQTLNSEEDEVVSRVKGYIDEHYDEPLSLDTLSRIVHLNPSYLSHYFKTATGETLMSWLLRIRLQKAAHLLQTSDLKVNVISEMVGYNKAQYFIALFKKKYGMTPQQYRKQQN